MTVRVVKAEHRIAHFQARREAHELLPVRDAPELAVADDRQTALFLQPDHLADGVVLGCAQLVLGNLACRVLAERLAQLLGTQQAADMVGAEGRDHARSPRIYCAIESAARHRRRLMKAVALPRVAASARRRLSEIIDAAAKVFAQRGYHGPSTQDIADLLGMRQASLYYYFDSKEAALEAVCRHGHAGYVERLLEIARSDASASEKLAQALVHHIAPERRDLTLAFIRERRFLPLPARKRIRAYEVQYERAIQRIIEE